MKKFIALMTVMAFAFTAAANCGNCGSDKAAGKPKTECKCTKDCKADCKCACHKKKKTDEKA